MTAQVYGRLEMADLFEVDSRTGHAWYHRKLLPPPDHEAVNGGPAWDRSTLVEWGARTGRLPESLMDEGSAIASARGFKIPEKRGGRRIKSEIRATMGA